MDLLKKTTLVSLLSLSMASVIFAQEPNDVTPQPEFETVQVQDNKHMVFHDQSEQVLKKIQQKFPNLGATEVIYLPPVQLYEVRTDLFNPLSYTNADMTFFIIDGKIIDPSNYSNVSDMRDLSRIQDLFKSLPMDEAINIQYGNGERRIAIFSDPDCPYCKITDQDIHTNLQDSNITVSYFMNPLPIPGHENAPTKAKQIWCSDNKEQAWIDWMVHDKPIVGSAECRNPVDKNMELSKKLDFMMTPTIIFDNGIIWQGAIESKHIMEILNALPVIN